MKFNINLFKKKKGFIILILSVLFFILVLYYYSCDSLEGAQTMNPVTFTPPPNVSTDYKFPKPSIPSEIAANMLIDGQGNCNVSGNTFSCINSLAKSKDFNLLKGKSSLFDTLNRYNGPNYTPSIIQAQNDIKNAVQLAKLNTPSNKPVADINDMVLFIPKMPVGAAPAAKAAAKPAAPAKPAVKPAAPAKAAAKPAAKPAAKK